MRDALVVSLFSLLPRNATSRAMGAAARSAPSRWLTGLFVRAYEVNLGEAEQGPEAYPTLDALFTRRLRAGARPVAEGPHDIVSPVDGTCAFVGPTVGGLIEPAPGRRLSLSALLGERVEGERDAVVLYLSPKDYHRVHVPREGVFSRWRYLPGTLWPVFPAAVRRVEGLFARNERAVLRIDTSAGPLDVVMVGAFGVGRIEVPEAGLGTNAGHPGREGTLAVPVTRGADLGVFHLGSTVVLVAPVGAFTWTVRPGASVRMGSTIGACR